MTQQEWEIAPDEERKAEIEKCYNEPWYHYNTYYKPVGGMEYTKDMWEGMIGFIQTGGRRRRKFDPVALDAKIEYKTPPKNKSPYDGSAMRFKWDTDPDMPWQIPMRLAFENPELYQKLLKEQEERFAMWRKAFPLNIPVKGKAVFLSPFEDESKNMRAMQELWEANTTFGYAKETEHATEGEAKDHFNRLTKLQWYFTPAYLKHK